MRDYADNGLQKKVMLMHHFCKNMSTGLNLGFESDCDRLGQESLCESAYSNSLIVYVKKWAASRRSILFLLSTGVIQVDFISMLCFSCFLTFCTFQVLFADRSEIVVNTDKIAKFTDKVKGRFQGVRTEFCDQNNISYLCHVDGGCRDKDRDDFRRRLHYTGEMLRQMSQNV
jgi:hypothetical protein